MHHQEKYSPLQKCSQPFIPPQTDGMIHFSLNIGFSESKVIFKRRKKANMSNKNALQGANFGTSCTSLRTPATNKQTQSTRRKARLEPAIRDAQKLAQSVFPL